MTFLHKLRANGLLFSLTGAPPQIQQFPDDMKIMAGQEVILECKFTGALPISCTWLKFRKPVRVITLCIETHDINS